MIGCDISGGLGNQFFRYAFARKLLEGRRRMGIDDEMVINSYGIDQHGASGSLFDFSITPHRRVRSKRMVMDYGTRKQRLLYGLYALYWRTGFLHHEAGRNRLYRLLGDAGIIISDNPDHEELCFPAKTISRLFTHGSFETPAFFEGMGEVLRHEFTPPNWSWTTTSRFMTPSPTATASSWA